jgi:hypothetical protein
MKVSRVLFLVAILNLAAGCATTSLKGRADLLAFLADGRTTKDQVWLNLGPPSARFECDRILTYRLRYEPKNKGYQVVERSTQPTGWPRWDLVKYSLVLVFDEQGLLVKHALVEVN